MAETTKYYRVPGAYWGSFMQGKGTWVGSDHLMVSWRLMYTEYYRRFYFRDIQAIIIQPTADRLIQNILLGVIAGIWLVSLLAVLGARRPLVTWSWILACLFFGFMLLIMMNLFRGRTCRTFVKTAVSMQRLPNLDRLPGAQKFIDVMERQIMQHQPMPKAQPVAAPATPWAPQPEVFPNVQ